MHLDRIVIVFSYLNEIDVANAVTANSNWSAIATSRRRVNALFSMSS